MKRFGLFGDLSRDFVTHGGRILWHTDPAELEFLFRGTVRAREIPSDVPADLLKHVSEHPQLSAVRFPLTRDQFRRQAA